MLTAFKRNVGFQGEARIYNSFDEIMYPRVVGATARLPFARPVQRMLKNFRAICLVTWEGIEGGRGDYPLWTMLPLNSGVIGGKYSSILSFGSPQWTVCVSTLWWPMTVGYVWAGSKTALLDMSLQLSESARKDHQISRQSQTYLWRSDPNCTHFFQWRLIRRRIFASLSLSLCDRSKHSFWAELSLSETWRNEVHTVWGISGGSADFWLAFSFPTVYGAF